MKSFEDLLQKIEEYQIIVVLRHIHPDYDALGSQYGLARWLQRRYPQKRIVASGHEPSIAPSFLPNPEEISLEDCVNALAIAVDTSNYARIDGKDIWDTCKERMFFDHHVKGDSLTEYEYVDEHTASCSEIITDFIRTFEKEPVALEVAEPLYCGIISDSIRFSINTTTAYTLKMASYLLESQLDINKVNNQVFSMSVNLYRFSNHLREIANYDTKGFVYAIINKEDYVPYHVEAGPAKAKVNVFGEIRGIQIWAVFIEEEDGVYSASLRSHSMTISDIANQFGGGGHLCASGISKLSRSQCDEVIELLKQRVLR